MLPWHQAFTNLFFLFSLEQKSHFSLCLIKNFIVPQEPKTTAFGSKLKVLSATVYIYNDIFHFSK